MTVVPAGQERDELDGELRHERLLEKDDVDEAIVDGRLCGELELAPPERTGLSSSAGVVKTTL
ncbi:hypothetical protein [Brevibacterium iodinum]|uniref:hypothetical protein n=1 Tax=Brevibacterium iodinum TaxID=31943 RepID=UPI000C7585FF|nr:hypothetical protein [Brevibacterium iodinum]